MPTPAFPTFLAFCTVALVLLGANIEAHAELGGAMPNGANSGSGAPRSVLNGALLRRTSTDAGGTTIDEYATSSGQIIAYAWQGPTMPDLQTLLGAYAGSYRAGAAAGVPDGNLHASRVVRPDVIVESGGPMRGYVGRAWLPAALPPGVSADDLH
ncbi:DUF2844 domain-containing protein [Paraburkholderia sp. BCC1884]|uniref:DUF2844 domain-containing protein n=1 Tax=Paraburkholderia sp. BCC1884 TaxID=2562668 RepID=UPI0011845947|nr:DUF2844 domain-containing protein [Paraburkholderia sp. BCC1884]